MNDPEARTELYLWTQYFSVTDSLDTIMARAADIAELSPDQQLQMIQFALAKNKGLDTNVAGLTAVVTNNLGKLPPGWIGAAKTYVLLRGLGAL